MADFHALPGLNSPENVFHCGTLIVLYGCFCMWTAFLLWRGRTLPSAMKRACVGLSLVSSLGRVALSCLNLSWQTFYEMPLLWQFFWLEVFALGFYLTKILLLVYWMQITAMIRDHTNVLQTKYVRYFQVFSVALTASYVGVFALVSLLLNNKLQLIVIGYVYFPALALATAVAFGYYTCKVKRTMQTSVLHSVRIRYHRKVTVVGCMCGVSFVVRAAGEFVLSWVFVSPFFNWYLFYSLDVVFLFLVELVPATLTLYVLHYHRMKDDGAKRHVRVDEPLLN